MQTYSKALGLGSAGGVKDIELYTIKSLFSHEANWMPLSLSLQIGKNLA